jgi:hypothetical protein
MATKSEKTMIQVNVKTRERLAKLGRKRETYDQIITFLIDFFKERGE